MKRRLSVSKFWRSAIVAAASACAMVGITTVSKPAAAQEIQLTGPLAGAPSVRKLRTYREGRFEIAIGPGATLLDEYQRTMPTISGRLQYNVFDWLGVGVFGFFAPVSLSTDLTDKINSTAPRNTRTQVNLPPAGQDYADQTGKLNWMAAPQLTFTPFRGKLALFQKLFVDTDLYLHAGAAFVGVTERKNCAVGQCFGAGAFGTEGRVAIAPTFGLGLSFYVSSLVSINLEYRAFPFSWNRGGFDTRGTGPDASFPDNQINDEDRTFKFNQMVFAGVGFHFPTKAKISD